MSDADTGEDDVLAISAFDDAGATHHETASRYLASQGLRVRWICVASARWPEEVWPTDRFRVDARPRSRSPLGKLLWQAKLTTSLARRLASHRGAVYVCGSYATPAVYPLLPFIPRQRLLYHTQDYLEPSQHPGRARIERAVARRAAFVFVNEENRGRFLQSNYALAGRPITIPTALPRDWPVGIRTAEGRTISGRAIAEEEVLLLHLGGYAINRCTPALLDAVAKLEARYRLVFTGSPPGSGSHQKIMEHAHRLGIADRMILLPFLSYQEVFQLIADSDLGILLYPDDGVGNFYQSPGRLTEFAASGVPIITSRFPGLQNLLFQHPMGSTADPTSSEEIARAIREATARHPRSLETNLRIRSLFRDKLAYEINAPRLLSAFRQVLQGSHA